jgi:SanA protein
MFKRKLLIIIISLIIFSILFTIYTNVTIAKYKKLTTNNIESLTSQKAGLLLGSARYLNNGYGNPYFFNRIEAAVELYKSGKIKYIIVSGDNSRKDYDEPSNMKEELIKRGVPEDVIFLDYAGFRTLDSVVRAKEIFGQDSLIVISQKFHNERAVFIAEKNGIKAYGYNAKDIVHKDYKTKIREILARNKVFIDLLFNVEPKFYGEKINIP